MIETIKHKILSLYIKEKIVFQYTREINTFDINDIGFTIEEKIVGSNNITSTVENKNDRWKLK